ncbi:exodeoxyribonuclease I [Endozoicomonas sp. SM1973]|uniref:Exodeoxyribonuclease I n=1 Tax=Spartinivicinus marinus TaxID=2994442 RepID=A0A853I9U2_9GAMM|nr:exodeoxyribonuclease I [Spartinivicinus marinus]MCX4028458.1 exodeoxyribonuclease I [Spartinivicinus marinus]NYZ67428.1 exodeoxyribonuclease I [Spartinivicinus marinus]
MPQAPTLYWYDFETFGADPAKDWPAQFAGIRTDQDFNEIGSPDSFYCRLPDDQLPNPEACLITGITPQTTYQHGITEAAFADRIYQQFSQAHTCVLGYNSIRFDDEVTRHLLYRNFFDPYAREWKNGNSRWDLLDVVRAAYALRPEGIEWPINEEGLPSFKLELLTQANGIAHTQAHDALSDVRATIALAKLLREKQPKLFNFMLSIRHKKQVLKYLSTGQPVVHISGMFSANRGCMAVVMPLAEHPTNNNGRIVYDLSVDPTPLLTLSVEEIRERLFTPASKLSTGVERIPLKTIHINKCPIIAPLNVLQPADQERWQIDLNSYKQHHRVLVEAPGLGDKVAEVFNQLPETQTDNPDLMLYSGGFFSPYDRSQMNRLKTLPPSQLADMVGQFQDSRLDTMLFRYRARNYPETLTASEDQRWQSWCQARLLNKGAGGSICLSELQALIRALLSTKQTPHEQTILRQLQQFADEKQAALQLP